MIYWLIFYGFAAGVAAGIFAWPVSRALLSTLATMRDPNVMSAPENTWILFKRIFGMRIRRWVIVWPAVLCAAYFFFLGSHSSRSGYPFWIDAVNALNAPAMLAGLGTMMVVSALWWAPRCRETWALMSLGVGMGVGLYATLAFGVYYLLPSELMLIELRAPLLPSGRVGYVAMYFDFIFAACGVIAVALSLRIKQKMREWIRHD
jgi:hypothetical protein